MLLTNLTNIIKAFPPLKSVDSSFNLFALCSQGKAAQRREGDVEDNGGDDSDVEEEAFEGYFSVF